jgi:hypothetical protein
MSIDERLEALSQGVDLLEALHRDNEKAILELRREMEARFSTNETRLVQLMDAVNRLSRILEAHDEKNDDHDRRLDDLET